LFIKGIVAHDNFPDWMRLWDELIYEKIGDEEMSGGRHKNDDENLYLASQEKKGNFKKITSEESTSQNEKK
jgi:hypothetical protein